MFEGHARWIVGYTSIGRVAFPIQKITSIKFLREKHTARVPSNEEYYQNVRFKTDRPLTGGGKYPPVKGTLVGSDGTAIEVTQLEFLEATYDDPYWYSPNTRQKMEVLIGEASSTVEFSSINQVREFKVQRRQYGGIEGVSAKIVSKAGNVLAGC